MVNTFKLVQQFIAPEWLYEHTCTERSELNYVTSGNDVENYPVAIRAQINSVIIVQYKPHIEFCLCGCSQERKSNVLLFFFSFKIVWPVILPFHSSSCFWEL